MAHHFSGFTRVGTMYVRGTFHINVPATGVEFAVWAKMFPMLVVPEEYWFNFRAVGSVLGTAPDSSQEMHIRGAISSMNLAQEDVETDDFDGDEILDRYFDPRTGSSFSGDDADAPTDLGLSSQASGTRSALYSSKELFSNTEILGLPNKAVFSDANQITYITSFRRHGLFKQKQVNIELPHAVALGANCDAIPDATDWSTVLTGDAGGMNDLYIDILTHVGYGAAGTLAPGVQNISGAMFDYINNGLIGSAVDDVDQAMHCRVKGTVKTGVYTIDPKRQVLTSYR